MARLKTIVIDDKWLFREELKTFLLDYPEIELVGEAQNIAESIKLIKAVNPDVIFLDIQLSGETGFDLLEKINITSKIIFITAYNQYAIRAFEVNARDYLLKPIRKDRLTQAIKRLLPMDEEGDTQKSDNKLEYNDLVYLMINGSLKFIKVSRLKCITAERNYSYIICSNNKKYLVSKTLVDWEKILPGKYFVRIHRSTIVNFEFVEKVKKCKNYTHEVYISCVDEPFSISRRYATKLKKQFSW